MSPQLKLRQLKYFVVVADELNFRRAAERLCITQPPLSRQIRMLEEALGANLFERDRQGVRLTEAGERFLMDARALVRDSEQVVARFNQQGANAKPAVRLGITTVIDVGLCSWIESAFEKRFPGVRLSIKRQISIHSIWDLNQGLIVVALVGLPSRADGLTVEHLYDDPMVACIASSHRAAKRRKLSILDLASDRLFWFNRKLNPAYYDHCQKVFARLGFSPERTPEPADHHVLLGLIGEGRGIALLPRSLQAITRQGVVFKQIEEGDQLGIRLAVAHDPVKASEAACALLAVIKEGFAERGR